MNARRALTLCALLGSAASLAQDKSFGDWPAGTDPREVGKRVAERFIPTPHMEMPSHGNRALHYAHVATWVGVLQFAQLTRDEDLRVRLVTPSPMPNGTTRRPMGSRSRHAGGSMTCT